MLQQHLNSQSCPTNASSFFQQLLSIGVSVSFFFFVFSFFFPAVLVVDARLTRGTQSPSQWFAAATSLAKGCDSSSSSSSCLKLWSVWPLQVSSTRNLSGGRGTRLPARCRLEFVVYRRQKFDLLVLSCVRDHRLELVFVSSACTKLSRCNKRKKKSWPEASKATFWEKKVRSLNSGGWMWELQSCKFELLAYKSRRRVGGPKWGRGAEEGRWLIRDSWVVTRPGWAEEYW
jgi:hypothetical protein